MALASQPLTTRGGSCGMLVVGSFFYLPSQTRNPPIFPSPISNAGLDFGFSNSPKIPPNCPKFVQSQIFYLVNYYSGNWKIQISPKCPKFSQFTQNFPNFQSPTYKLQLMRNKLLWVGHQGISVECYHRNIMQKGVDRTRLQPS